MGPAHLLHVDRSRRLGGSSHGRAYVAIVVELPPEHLLPPPAEDGLSGGVPVDDQAARVHDDDRVGHGGKDRLALTRWFHRRQAARVTSFEQTRNRINTYRVAAVDGTLQI